MRAIRTLVWIVVTAIVVGFLFMNWGESVQVKFWPLEDSYLHFEWPVGFIALVFFLLGFVPMWLFYRAGRWRLNRRISALEHSMRAISTPPSPPLATTTQLEAENTESPQN